MSVVPLPDAPPMDPPLMWRPIRHRIKRLRETPVIQLPPRYARVDRPRPDRRIQPGSHLGCWSESWWVDLWCSDEEFDALPPDIRAWRPADGPARVEDIRWMVVVGGEGYAGVRERLRALTGEQVSSDAMDRFLWRHGAHDVIALLHGRPAGAKTEPKVNELIHSAARARSHAKYREKRAEQRRAARTAVAS